MPGRESADVVVPVAGDVAAVLSRMRALELRPGDTLTVVDNRGAGASASEVLVAAELRTSYFARNAGARRGSAPWIVFLDADVVPPPGLLDTLLTPAPGASVGVLAGGIVDEPAGDASPAAVRYAARRRSMSQDTTSSGRGRWAFAQTACAAMRRSAFVEAGGFEPGVRSGGDADLCFRLRDLGWELEVRPDAAVVHLSRATVPALLANRFRHGTGAGWLDRRHPGSMPARRLPGLAWWALRRAATGAALLARGQRDAGLEALIDGPAVWAFELGRRVPNRPLRSR